MNANFKILSYCRANPDDQRRGLLAFLVLEYGDLQLDGVVLRRTATGRYALSFPEKTDRAGRRHPYIRPVDDAARRRIEAEVLGDLVRQEAGS